MLLLQQLLRESDHLLFHQRAFPAEPGTDAALPLPSDASWRRGGGAMANNDSAERHRLATGQPRRRDTGRQLHRWSESWVDGYDRHQSQDHGTTEHHRVNAFWRLVEWNSADERSLVTIGLRLVITLGAATTEMTAKFGKKHFARRYR